MIDLLRAEPPDGPLMHGRDLFGSFVGIWDVEWHGKDLNGVPMVAAGEVAFGWILAGTAIQDVWRVPTDPADRARMRAFHGTTIRFYDPTIAAWRSTWIDPMNGRVRRFIGRSINGDILLEGLDADPLERWSFRDITPVSFHWRGESSLDGGRHWYLEDEMFARRRAAGIG